MKHRIAPALSVTLALVALALPARGALPPRHGGHLTLPAPQAIESIDPVRARTHFEATLARAVFDGLYEVQRDGSIAPVLAEGAPVVEGALATIRLRPGVIHHGGRPVTARHVVRSIARASSAPEASWLLAAFATENGRPAVRELDDRTIQIQLARPGLRVERVLAASPLAIVVGGALAQRPVATGPFRARLDGHGGLELGLFRYAPDGAPWMNRVRFVPPQERDEEVRAFELGRLDGSWWGRSLYGGEPVRPTTTTTATTAPILLVPNRARALRDDALWGGVAGAIDRRRLERVGLTPNRSLGAGLPAPDLPAARPLARGTRLRMIVRAGSALEVRLGEAIAGLLDEHGVRLAVERVASDRYEAAAVRGDWDLRLALVRAPLPGRGALTGAALAAAGQIDRARRAVLALDDAEASAQAARTLGAMILGHERVVLHHRADLVGMRFDELGRLPLADVSIARATPPEEAP